jgi:hypothetical protein
MQSTYVWFAHEPMAAQREVIASGAPVPMKKANWYGPVLVLLNFGSMEHDLPSD